MIGFSWHIQGDEIGFGPVVTPTDVPGMSVKVDSGIAALPRNSGKMYRVYCGLDAPETLTIPTAITQTGTVYLRRR